MEMNKEALLITCYCLCFGEQEKVEFLQVSVWSEMTRVMCH